MSSRHWERDVEQRAQARYTRWVAENTLAINEQLIELNKRIGWLNETLSKLGGADDAKIAEMAAKLKQGTAPLAQAVKDHQTEGQGGAGGAER